MADLYATLGVSRTASAAELKKSYRKLAREHHPDVNPGNEKAEQRLKEVNQAYDVLSDPKKRKMYDQFGDDSMRQGFSEQQARAYQQYRGHRGGGGGADIQDLLNQMFGGTGGGGGNPFARAGQGGFGQRARPTKGSDQEATLQLDFLDALRGSERSITLRQGMHEGGAPKSITVRIPPGADDGAKLRLAGKGSPSHNGGPSGDLILNLRVNKHSFLKREGRNLEMYLPITVAEAIRGAKVQVPTLEGPVTLRLPAKSQTGQRLRLKGRGVPSKRHGPGDLYVTLRVMIPAGDGTRLEDLADELEQFYTDDVRAELTL